MIYEKLISYLERKSGQKLRHDLIPVPMDDNFGAEIWLFLESQSKIYMRKYDFTDDNFNYVDIGNSIFKMTLDFPHKIVTEEEIEEIKSNNKEILKNKVKANPQKYLFLGKTFFHDLIQDQVEAELLISRANLSAFKEKTKRSIKITNRPETKKEIIEYAKENGTNIKFINFDNKDFYTRVTVVTDYCLSMFRLDKIYDLETLAEKVFDKIPLKMGDEIFDKTNGIVDKTYLQEVIRTEKNPFWYEYGNEFLEAIYDNKDDVENVYDQLRNQIRNDPAFYYNYGEQFFNDFFEDKDEAEALYITATLTQTI